MNNFVNGAPEDCTHNCSTCGATCAVDENGERKKSFFQRMEEISESMNAIGEENILEILNTQIDEWEAEEGISLREEN